jgi:hypothetical protein
MATPEKFAQPPAASSYSWIQMVADTLERFQPGEANREQTRVQPCVIRGKPALVHASDLAERSPALYRYLKNFAQIGEIQLIADRRGEAAQVREERRRHWAPVVALGASMLFTESGESKDMPRPSMPQVRRNIEDDPLDVFQVVKLAAEVRAHGDRVRLNANGMLVQNRGQQHHIDHFQHTLAAFGSARRYSYFEGKSFHALGYRIGDQLSLDVLVGGGPLNAPRLWGPIRRMARDAVEFHLVRGRGEADAFGVMKASYYLDAPLH